MGAKSSKKDEKEELEQPPPSAKPKPSPFGEPEQFQQQNNTQPSTKGLVYFTFTVRYIDHIIWYGPYNMVYNMLPYNMVY